MKTLRQYTKRAFSEYPDEWLCYCVFFDINPSIKVLAYSKGKQEYNSGCDVFIKARAKEYNDAKHSTQSATIHNKDKRDFINFLWQYVEG